VYVSTSNLRLENFGLCLGLGLEGSGFRRSSLIKQHRHTNMKIKKWTIDSE